MPSQTSVSISNKVPIVDTFDVIVIGAGPAGIMASLAASRNGAKTLVIERYGSVGGAMTFGLVAPAQTFSVFGRPIVGGYPRELMQRLAKSGHATFPALETTKGDWRGLTYWDPETLGVRFDPEALKSEALSMLLESNAQIRFHTLVVDIITESRTVVTVSKSGYEAFSANIIIDCSGDADIASMAGCSFHKGHPDDQKALQPPTLMMRLGGVDCETANSHRADFPKIIEKASRKGDLDLKREDLLFYRGTTRHGECIVNCSRVYAVDGTNANDLTRAEIEGRRQNLQLLAFFRSYIPGFENSYLIDMATQVGIRETRRILGEYVLTRDDVLEGTHFEDTIALSYWPIDQHLTDGPGTILEFAAPGIITRIPYRCLIPAGQDFLLVAGRCISATREAFASIRCSGTAMALGQAAGTAAALAALDDRSVSDISVKQLLATLRSQQAIVDW